jgi:DNA invertase Pin-like site-specific DNA recombinase
MIGVSDTEEGFCHYQGVMRTALYARVSTDDGRQDTENQIHELREYAKRQGWNIAAEYIDHASGKNGKGSTKRPKFDQLFKDAKAKQFDMVFFWSLDRFTREGVKVTLDYLAELDSCGVCWKSYQEQFIDSCGPFKDAVISIMATLAKMERERISERTKAGMRRAKREGKLIGAPAKFVLSADNIQAERDKGKTLAAIAAEHGVSVRTVIRGMKD